MTARLLLSLILACGASPAFAQATDQTGTGGGPDTTLRAPNTSAVGRTKPPGNAGAPLSTEEEKRRNRIEKENNAIESGICIGCDK